MTKEENLMTVENPQPATGSLRLIDAILTGKTVAPSFYEGWQAQRVIDAAIVSHKQGGWVEV